MTTIAAVLAGAALIVGSWALETYTSASGWITIPLTIVGAWLLLQPVFVVIRRVAREIGR